MPLSIKQYKQNHFRVYSDCIATYFFKTDKVVVEGKEYERKERVCIGYGAIDDDYYSNYNKDNIRVFEEGKWRLMTTDDMIGSNNVTFEDFMKNKALDFFNTEHVSFCRTISSFEPTCHECDWLKIIGIENIVFECPSQLWDSYDLRCYFGSHYSDNVYINIFWNIIEKFYLKDGLPLSNVAYLFNGQGACFNRIYNHYIPFLVQEYGGGHFVAIKVLISHLLKQDLSGIKFDRYWDKNWYVDDSSWNKINFSNIKKDYKTLTDSDRITIMLNYIKRIAA